MAKIKEVKARQILDSRGNPTVEADILLENNAFGRASVPSGASTGSHEAFELRDIGIQSGASYAGQSVSRAVSNINTEIKALLINKEAENQGLIDQELIKLDGTERKSRLGANAILAVSLAIAKAQAESARQHLFQYISSLCHKNLTVFKLPVPMFNIFNGGKHAFGSTDIQEFMVVPNLKNFSKNLEAGVTIFKTLGETLKEMGHSTTVGDEGGFAPKVSGNQEALDLITAAIKKAGFSSPAQAVIALDIASSEFFDNGRYKLKSEDKNFDTTQMVDWLKSLLIKYPIFSIEDGLAEDDISGWQLLTRKIGSQIMLVGDDLLVTNPKRLNEAISKRIANAVLIKPNQIGTLSETLQTIDIAKKNNYKVIISHRSGETDDAFISHLAVGVDADFIKAGSLCRGERLAKYNELLRIEEVLSVSSNK